MPKEVKTRALEHMTDPSSAFKWFHENYIYKPDHKGKYVSLKGMYEHIKNSRDYSTLTKAERRAFTYTSLQELFKGSRAFRPSYREKYRPIINGTQKSFNNVLVGYVARSAYDADVNDDNNE